MRRTLIAVSIALLLVTVASADARAAVIYNTSVSVQSTSGLSVSNPSNATGSPDTSRMALNGGRNFPDSAVIRFTFTSLGVTTTNTQTYAVIVDGWNSNWNATISAINGTSVTSGTVSQTGASLAQNYVVYLPANVSGFSPHTAVSTIDITFTTTQIRGAILVDTVGTPEPATLVLFGLGLVGLGSYSWSKRRKKQRSRAA